MAPPPRSLEQRKQDTLARLEQDEDAWVATTGADQVPYLVPLSFLWTDGSLVIATPGSNPTSRNIQATGRVRLAIGPSRDVVMIEGTAEVIPDEEAAGALGDAFTAKAGFDPRRATPTFRFFRIRPRLVQAWRLANEIKGRDLMTDGRWLS